MAETTFEVKKENLQVVMGRVLNASRERVFKAYTNPEDIKKWWGQKNSNVVVEEMDVRVGGKWRFIEKSGEKDYAFRGEYKEVTPVERLSYTFEYEPMPGHVLTETIELEELDGKTKVTSTAQYENIEDLEGMVNMGMEKGARESIDKLVQLVET